MVLVVYCGSFVLPPFRKAPASIAIAARLSRHRSTQYLPCHYNRYCLVYRKFLLSYNSFAESRYFDPSHSTLRPDWYILLDMYTRARLVPKIQWHGWNGQQKRTSRMFAANHCVKVSGSAKSSLRKPFSSHLPPAKACVQFLLVSYSGGHVVVIGDATELEMS